PGARRHIDLVRTEAKIEVRSKIPQLAAPGRIHGAVQPGADGKVPHESLPLAKTFEYLGYADAAQLRTHCKHRRRALKRNVCTALYFAVKHRYAEIGKLKVSPVRRVITRESNAYGPE